jgi:hypothetical protein
MFNTSPSLPPTPGGGTCKKNYLYAPAPLPGVGGPGHAVISVLTGHISRQQDL